MILVLPAPWLPAEQLAPDAARAWLRHVVPLPHEVELTAARSVPRGSVRIAAVDTEAPIVRSAVAELRRAVGEADAPPQATIRLVLGGPGAERLRDLPASEQAYRIRPRASGRGLVVTALRPPGLYYGALTLSQLIEARAAGDTLQLPVLTVTDWPDMPDRGLWGSDNFLEVEWMAHRKLNLIQQISWLHVTPDGRGEARLKDGREPMVELGPDLAMRPVPAILHLEQLSGKGLFEAYPKLRAQGGGEGAICYSRPEFSPVLADWMVELGSLRGVTTVEVWMAENLHGEGGCQCPDCAGTDRDVLEARAILAAWQLARERLPGLRLRVMTSEETHGSNEAVLAELPTEVGVNYYHSLLTYTAMDRPMIPPLFAEAAQERWVGVVPSFVGAVRPVQPFTGPQFMHARMTELVSEGLSGVMGYATPRVRFARFNVEAAAEWSWNAFGRTPRQFARSWAVREGLAQPEAFAEWAETLGPVAWDVYGSEWPVGVRRGHPGPVSELLMAGELPALGEIKWGVFPAPWGEIQSAEELSSHLRDADAAMVLARRVGDPRVVQETRVIHGYVQALAALHTLKTLAPDGAVEPEERDRAAAGFRAYIEGLRQAAEALPAWETAVTGEQPRFTDDSLALLEEMMARMRTAAEQMDVPME
ncbi:MAG: glycoside hydrolase family 20 zincin-like fold domain-containing protein [Armatimonadota bacterium]